MKVRMGYESGGLSFHPWFATIAAQYPAQNIKTLLRGGDPGLGNWFWLGVGALATIAMTAARSRFVWFPLHPLGYLLAHTAPTQRAWFSFFLGWLCKVLVTRFGGHEAIANWFRRPWASFWAKFRIIFWLVIDASQGRGLHSLYP